MKKKDALNWIRIHTYNGNHGLAMRIYCENRISRKDFDSAVERGNSERLAAEKCKN